MPQLTPNVLSLDESIQRRKAEYEKGLELIQITEEFNHYIRKIVEDEDWPEGYTYYLICWGSPDLPKFELVVSPSPSANTDEVNMRLVRSKLLPYAGTMVRHFGAVSGEFFWKSKSPVEVPVILSDTETVVCKVEFELSSANSLSPQCRVWTEKEERTVYKYECTNGEEEVREETS